MLAPHPAIHRAVRILLSLVERRWFRVFISFGLMAVLLSIIDLDEALQVMTRASPMLIALGFFLFVPDRIFAAYRWYILLRGDNPHLRYLETLRLTFLSNFLGFFLPGQIGIEIIRVIGLRAAKVDLAASISSIILERCFAVFGLLIILFLGLAFVPATLSGPSLTIGIVVGATLFTGLLVIGNVRARRAVQTIIPDKIYGLIDSKLEKLYAALDQHKNRIFLLFYSLIIGVIYQLFRLTHVYIFAISLGIDVCYLVFISILSAIRLIVMIPISIAGIGLREASYVFMLGTVGVHPESALTLSLIVFFSMLIASLPGAIFLRRFEEST